MDILNTLCKLLTDLTPASTNNSNRGNCKYSTQTHKSSTAKRDFNKYQKLVEFHSLEDLNHKMAFRDKNAVITGGASGIGLQVCKQLLANEASVREQA